MSFNDPTGKNTITVEHDNGYAVLTISEDRKLVRVMQTFQTREGHHVPWTSVSVPFSLIDAAVVLRDAAEAAQEAK